MFGLSPHNMYMGYLWFPSIICNHYSTDYRAAVPTTDYSLVNPVLVKIVDT